MFLTAYLVNNSTSTPSRCTFPGCRCTPPVNARLSQIDCNLSQCKARVHLSSLLLSQLYLLYSLPTPHSASPSPSPSPSPSCIYGSQFTVSCNYLIRLVLYLLLPRNFLVSHHASPLHSAAAHLPLSTCHLAPWWLNRTTANALNEAWHAPTATTTATHQ